MPDRYVAVVDHTNGSLLHRRRVSDALQNNSKITDGEASELHSCLLITILSNNSGNRDF